jgi:LysR family glycine cleavage system transcriptional activator
MKRLLPPLNALRAFEAAGRLGSFKEAATFVLRWLVPRLVKFHAKHLELVGVFRSWIEEEGKLAMGAIKANPPLKN